MKWLAGLLALMAVPAAAQVIPDRSAGPELDAFLERPEEIVQNVKVWDVDIDGDGQDDRFVQAAYSPASGGNAFWLRFFVLPGIGRTGGNIEVTLDAVAIESVRLGPGGPVAVTLHYGPDDGRCCPSVRRLASIRLEDLQPI